MTGWIKLHRSLLEWEWYDDVNVMRLFLHCILKANHKDKKHKGTLVLRGSFLTGFDVLSQQTGLSVRQVRTALSKLESTSEVTRIATSKGQAITVVNYDKYQNDDRQATSETTSTVTNQRQASDKPTTTNKKDNNGKNEKKSRGLDLTILDSMNPETKSSVIEWIDYRKKIKNKPLTQHGLNKLLKSSQPAIISAINESIMNGYLGVFPDKHENKPSQHSTPKYGNDGISSTMPQINVVNDSAPTGWQNIYKELYERTAPLHWHVVAASKQQEIKTSLKQENV